jgi:hypothetical protein
MKFLSLLFLLSSLNVFAATKGTIDEFFCGEMDPFVVGDVCILNVTQDDGKKLAIVLDFDSFAYAYDEGALKGKRVALNIDTLSYIYDEDALEVLRDFDDSYFYMFGDEFSFRILASARDAMTAFAEANPYFSGYRQPEAPYSTKRIENFKVNKKFAAYLKEQTKSKLIDWEALVLYSGEYDHVSDEERANILANPKKELGVEYLLEIDDVHEVYQNGKLIGYFVQVSDHVQGAIYQDGAWINMFLDLNQKVVKAVDDAA